MIWKEVSFLTLGGLLSFLNTLPKEKQDTAKVTFSNRTPFSWILIYQGEQK